MCCCTKTLVGGTGSLFRVVSRPGTGMWALRSLVFVKYFGTELFFLCFQQASKHTASPANGHNTKGDRLQAESQLAIPAKRF